MLLKSISDLNTFKSNNTHFSFGLVPTMGALHQGHLSLIRRASEDCDCVVVSIFVNPTQFNNSSDLSNYPRTLDQDIKSIEKIDKDVLVYAPHVDEIYPEGIHSNHYEFGDLSKYMEGEFRQGHFDGVGTVLERIFNLVRPDKAYFGEKDFQQLAVVRKLVKLTGQNVEIIGCQTYREDNGLAKSSRNKLLTEKEKTKAGIIYEQLLMMKENIDLKPITEIKDNVFKAFSSSQMFRLEYVEIASVEDLIPTEIIEPDKTYRAFIAVYCNDVRLIDNMALN